MRIISIADLHCTALRPISRKDDYTKAWMRKLRQVVDYTNKVGGTLVIPGDLSDKPTLPIWLLNQLIDEFSRLEGEAIVIPGNHDTPGHGLEFIRQSVLWTLHKALPRFSLCHIGEQTRYGEGDQEVIFHTAPFDSDIALLQPRPGAYNILVAHLPVFEKEVPFYMPSGMTVEALEATYPGFNLYLVGDIHTPAVRSKTVVTGSMMRSNILQKDHQPRFYDIDTSTGTITVVPFEIDSEVWKEQVEASDIGAEWVESLKGFSAALRDRSEKLDYLQVVGELTKEDKSSYNIIKELSDEYRKGN